MSKSKTKLSEEAKKAMTGQVRRLIADPESSVDTDGLLRDLIDIWGGTHRLAQDFMLEFKAAAPGSLTRQRILEMMQRLIITNTAGQAGRRGRPEDLDDLDLDRVIREHVEKVQTDGHGSAAPAAG